MCTRILGNTLRAIGVGRTMDCPESTEPILTVEFQQFVGSPSQDISARKATTQEREYYES